jgi:hypothetical protein
MIASGLLVEHVPGRVGLILNLICLFLNHNGFGVCVASWYSVVRLFISLCQVDTMLGPCSAYSIDIFRDRSAEAMAATS